MVHVYLAKPGTYGAMNQSPTQRTRTQSRGVGYFCLFSLPVRCGDLQSTIYKPKSRILQNGARCYCGVIVRWPFFALLSNIQRPTWQINSKGNLLWQGRKLCQLVIRAEGIKLLLFFLTSCSFKLLNGKGRGGTVVKFILKHFFKRNLRFGGLVWGIKKSLSCYASVVKWFSAVMQDKFYLNTHETD